MGAGATKNIEKENLTIRLPSEGSGSSEILRSKKCKDKLLDNFPQESVNSLYENFYRSVKNHGKKPCMGWRENDGPYKWITYEDAWTRVKNFGSGLANLGMKPKDFVGIYSINRVAWVITEQAVNAYSLTIVPLYDTLGVDACEYIVNQTELTLLVCSGDKLANVAKLVTKSPSIKFVISMDPFENSVKEGFPEHVKLLYMGDVEKDGAEHPQEVIPPAADDVATICYTSGTTGNPKGALVTHKNYIADTCGAIEHGMTICEDDVHISYLPLAHSMERTVQAALWYFGAAVGFYRGDVLKLLEDVGELKPTIFVSVPRLFNRIHDRVISQVEKTGGSKRDLFWKAYHVKEANLQKNKYTHKLYDGLVFKKVRARLGGRVRYMLTGSAPISAEVLNFLRICFSCPVIEGYGQTECCAAATLTSKNEVSMGHVGSPICSNELKLVDVPDMDYLVTDKPYPRGEVCIRGPNVFKGYFKEPEKTAEALDKDGWLHTGDIGHIDEYGNVKIIDRKKNIFKLSQGEYVAPEKIENIIVRVPLIAQSFVFGDSLQSQLVAIIVPDEEEASTWAKSNNITFSNFAELCQNDKLKDAILNAIVEISKTSQLKGFEIIRAIHLHSQLFSVENDILTPTFKLKRPQARKMFQEQLDAMYKTLNEKEKQQEKE